MTRGNRRPGPWGIAVLTLTAGTGLVLAVHGWSGRHIPAALGSVGGQAAAAGPSPSATGPSQHSPAPTGAGSPSPSAPGPLLSSQQYAQYAFQVWPGTLTGAAQAAMTGLTIRVHTGGSGLQVIAGVVGQPAAPPVSYPGGARVYVVEASLGDDSGTSDYNLGDDGIVITDAQGRILK